MSKVIFGLSCQFFKFQKLLPQIQYKAKIMFKYSLPSFLAARNQGVRDIDYIDHKLKKIGKILMRRIASLRLMVNSILYVHDPCALVKSTHSQIVNHFNVPLRYLFLKISENFGACCRRVRIKKWMLNKTNMYLYNRINVIRIFHNVCVKDKRRIDQYSALKDIRS